MDYFKKFPKRELHPPFSKLINEAVNNDFQSKSGRKPIQDYYYDNTCSIIHPKNNCITYAKAIKFLQKSNYKDENCIILVPTDLEKTPEFKEFKEKFSNVVFIGVKDPLVIFLDIHDYLHLDELPRQWFHKPKSLGNGIYVGENVEIGKNTIIYPGTVIYDNVKIGNNCLIHSNCSIGGDGFRFIQRDDGTLRKMIHISNPGVIIEDDVEIQSNCNVSRGVFDPTRIGKGTKIDALVHIAHNDVIGNDNIIAAQTCLSGSVEMGSNNWVGAGVVISNGVTIGNNNWLGLGVRVAFDVGNNEKLSGFYGVPHEKWMGWWKREFRREK